MKAIIFDFDGTIADTGAMLFSMANELLEEGGFEKISHSKLEELRKMTIMQGLRHLKISPRILPTAVKRSRQMINARINDLKPAEGMPEAIKELAKIDGLVLGILSSNTRGNVTKFLKKYDLFDKFNFIDVGASVFGKHLKLRQSIRKHRLSDYEVIYVGDEIRDIEAAHKAGLNIAVVPWGLNHPDVLEKYGPKYMLGDAKQLLEIANE